MAIWVGTTGDDDFPGATGFDNSGNDVLRGDQGNDTIYGGAGDDRIVGGLDDGTGSSGADELYGEAGNDYLIGDDGDDTLDGGADRDEAGYEKATQAVTVDLVAGTAAAGAYGTDTLINIEGVRGSAYNDTMTGNGADNFFRGLQGNDSLDGGAGSDWVYYDRDVFDGGIDGVMINLASGTATDGFADTDTLISIENARGTAVGDTIIGSDDDNHLQGLGGDDTLSGGMGNDILDGGDGADTLSGGSGSDWVYYDNDSLSGGNLGVTVDLAAGSATDGFGASDKLNSIENARGTDFGDAITGSDDANYLQGLGGDDTLKGQSGADTIEGDAGNDLILGGLGSDVIDGGDNNDTIKGARGHDTIHGDADDDLVNGAKGRDVLHGDDGNDILMGGRGKDQLFGGNDDDVLKGGKGDDSLDGGSGNDTLTGGGGEDVFIFNTLTNGEADLITDFRDGIDMIQLAGILGATKADKFAELDISKVSGGVEIEYNGHVITLDGVSIGDVGKGDFIFV